MRLTPEKLRPPPGFLDIVRSLVDSGHEAWAVGGAIRDACEESLVGARPAAAGPPTVDWDVATDARPDQVQSLFRRTVPIGIDHGTVGVFGPDEILYEVTTFRRDIETDGRHARVTFADTIDEDLGRRDFTINALAWHPDTHELRDPFDGVGDLRNGVLRAVGDPTDRFEEDYLRVLRGLRFAGRLDLEIEPATRHALRGAVAGLPGLSAERVREELMKVLGDPTPSSALDLYRECGVLQYWYPELLEPAGSRTSWRVNLAAVDAVTRTRPLVRLARLLAPMADDRDERGELAERILSRLRFSNAERRRVVGLVAEYLPFVSPLDSTAQVRRWLSTVGHVWRDLFRLHTAAARASPEASAYLCAAWRHVHDTVLTHPPLTMAALAVDGGDILDLGVPPGPLVGLVLEELLEQVLEDPDANERAGLLGEARRLVDLGALAGGGSDPDGSSGAVWP